MLNEAENKALPPAIRIRAERERWNKAERIRECKSASATLLRSTPTVFFITPFRYFHLKSTERRHLEPG